MSVVWCNTCGGLISSTEPAGGTPCSCGRQPIQPSPDCPLPHYSEHFVEGLRKQLDAANLQLSEAKALNERLAQVEPASIKALNGLIDKLKAKNSSLAESVYELDQRLGEAHKETKAAERLNGELEARLKKIAELLLPPHVEKRPDIIEHAWALADGMKATERPVVSSGICHCGHDMDQHTKSGPCKGECNASDSLGRPICPCCTPEVKRKCECGAEITPTGHACGFWHGTGTGTGTAK